jgi:hypothetical protein
MVVVVATTTGRLCFGRIVSLWGRYVCCCCSMRKAGTEEKKGERETVDVAELHPSSSTHNKMATTFAYSTHFVFTIGQFDDWFLPTYQHHHIANRKIVTRIFPRTT